MIIKNLFNIGDTVLNKTDKDRNKMIVTGITIRPTGIVYLCSFFEDERAFYGFELDEYQDEVVKRSRGEFKVLTIPYLKSLEYDEYINLLEANGLKTIRDILDMLVAGEEYEMAEVTRRYLDRLVDGIKGKD